MPVSGGPNNKIAFNDQLGNLFVMNSDGTGKIQLTNALNNSINLSYILVKDGLLTRPYSQITY